MNLASRVRKIEAAAACEACEISEDYKRRVRALIGEVEAGRPAERPATDLETFTARGCCPWCGRSEVVEYQADGDAARDLKTLWAALEAGRMCEPDIAELAARNHASLRESFGERAREYDALYKGLVRDLNALPPRRFPYTCAVEGCGCHYSEARRLRT